MPTSAAFYEDAARRLGRPLTAAELRIDVVAAVGEMELAKDRLRRAIDAEKRRAIRRYVEPEGGGYRLAERVDLRMTRPMMDALERLYRAGQAHARAEMRLMGVEPVTSYADEQHPVWRRLRGRLATFLAGIAVRVEHESVKAVFGGVATDVLREVDRRVPGALDAAGRMVSTAYIDGRADVYAANAELFSGWQYTAVMDGGTCDECASHDGEEYATLDDALSIMPDYGPNPACFGEDRCRCAIVPIGPA